MALFSTENIYIYVMCTIFVSTQMHTIYTYLFTYVYCACTHKSFFALSIRVLVFFMLQTFILYVYSSLKEAHPVLIFARKERRHILHTCPHEPPATVRMFLSQCGCRLVSPSTTYFLVFQSLMWDIFAGVSVGLFY